MRLCKTKDGRIVEDTHPEAEVLYKAFGDASELTDNQPKAAAKSEDKGGKKAQDKAVKKSEDKGGLTINKRGSE